MVEEKKYPSEEKKNGGLMYNINDKPPWPLSIFVAFQHCLTMFGPTLMGPLLVAQLLCLKSGSSMKAYLFCSTVFSLGISTLLQVTLGSRLPMVEGVAIEYIIALQPFVEDNCAIEISNSTTNETQQQHTNQTLEGQDWNIKLRKLQGAIIVAGVMEFIIGMMGLIGLIRRFITPMVIVPSLTMLGLMIVPSAANLSSKHWGISILTIILAIFFSQHIYRIEVPCYKYSRSKGCTSSKFPFFKVFAIILAVIIAWVLCGILTACGVFPDNPDVDETNGYFARTDIRKSIYEEASWFVFPYPGQWGFPIFSVTGTFATIPALLASIIDSLSEYYGCARMCSLPPPPNHSLNRGIAAEGLGTIISGYIGFGSGITTIGGNVGLIGLTKIASLRVIQVMGFILILMGVLGKFGAFFATIPDPVIGGILCIAISMMMGVAFSNLQNVDVTSRRNIFILGFSIFAGSMFPSWIKNHPEKLATGIHIIDDIFRGLLTSQMFVGGILGLILDNSIPGTREERGIIKRKKINIDDDPEVLDELNCYDPPYFSHYKSMKLLRFLPVSSTFKFPRIKRYKRNQQSSEPLSEVTNPILTNPVQNSQV